jgi:thiol-disulfide isomerase/thioredoxin
LLSEWNAQVDTLFTYSHGFRYNVIDYTTFFPLLPGFVEKANEFKKSINTGDKSFDELMQLMVETDMNLAALNFIYTPRRKHPTKDMYPEYYSYISKERAPKSERLLELANGYSYIRLYTMFSVLTSEDNTNRKDWNKIALSKIPNDLLKGYYAYEVIKRMKSYDNNYLNFKKMIEPYLLNDYLKNGVNEYEMTIRKIEAGAPSIDFAGTDITGKEHKLSDYRGTVVYVDVWATWCGPCKAQIPYLKKLEKKFHGKPVTFMSISVDKVKDRKKWENFVKEENLQGVQIMADNAFESDVAKAYKINAIPRFMIFDKEGKIVTIDAIRPGNEKIEDELNRLVSKK